MSYEKRATANFQRSIDVINNDLRDLLAEGSSKGTLRSGKTARLAIKIFETRTEEALDQTLTEMAKRIDHRGKEWKDACEEVGASLACHLSAGRQILSAPLDISGATKKTAAAREVDRLLAEVATRLRERLEEFREGWTAPKEKPWSERNPNWNRLVWMIFGAIFAVIIAAISRHFLGI